MSAKNISKSTKNEFQKFQKYEISEYYVYKKLSKSSKKKKNKKILQDISKDELSHYKIFKKYTKAKVKPDRFLIFKYVFVSRIFGLAFGLKLMEKNEESAIKNYKKSLKNIDERKKIIQDELKHEKKLVNLLKEEKLKYVSSIVLGLNDALVELTGALAGFTLALQKPNLIAITGLITGFSASLSMAASEYLSTKSNPESPKNPGKASLYTGISYIITVILLILPFFILDNVFLSLFISICAAVVIIFFFTYYISVAKDYNFKKRFLEMAGLSLGISAISFLVGYLIRHYFNVEV